MPFEVNNVKVAYLVNQYPMVSHSFIRREIHALEQRGVEVLRFSLRGWRGDLADAQDLEERGRTQYVLRGGIGGLVLATARLALRSPLRLLQGLWLAARMSRRSNKSLGYHLAYLMEACWIVPRLQAADVRHLHAHFGTNSTEVAMQAGVLCGIPFSFTVHGIAELDNAESIGLPEKIRRSAFTVAICAYVRAQLYRWAGPDHWEKVKVVHCGIEKSFHENATGTPLERPRLVCVARLSGEKGQLVLLRAAAMLAREGVEFELVLAGDGEMRGRIESEILRCGLARHVRITGWIDASQVREEILASRALVLPSFAEGLPVVIMEAMALRRPVISTYVAGIPELVEPGRNGWLVPAGDIELLAAAMKQCLATSTDQLLAMGESARLRALERHDVDTEVARLAALFGAGAGGVALEAGKAAWA